MSALVFCSCGDSADKSAASGSESATKAAQKTLKKADFGWAKCDVPEGYYSKSYYSGTQHYSIKKDGSNDYSKDKNEINLFLVEKSDDMQSFIDNELSHTGGAVQGDTVKMGNYTWCEVYDKDDDIRRFYAEADPTHVVGATVLGGMTVKDTPVTTVLESLEVTDTSKYGETESTEDDHLKVDPIG